MRKFLVLAGLVSLCGLPMSCGSNSSPSTPNNPPPTPTYTSTAFPVYTACVNPSGTPCTASPTSTATSTATPSPTASSTSTPTHTITFTVTSTPTVTHTFTVTPNPSLTPACGGAAGFFGKTTIGGTGTSLTQGRIWSVQASVNRPVTVTSLAAYVIPADSNSYIDMAIYSDNAGAPQSFLGATSGTQLILSGWNQIPSTPIYLGTGNYWLTFRLTTSSSVTLYYDAGAANSEADAVNGGSYPLAFPGGYASSNIDYSIYAVFCPVPYTPTNTPTSTATPTFTPTSTPTPPYSYSNQWGSGSSTATGSFNNPRGVASLDSGNNVYVADLANYRIQEFDSLGNLTRFWGTQGSGNGQFNQPVGIAVNLVGGDVYVVEDSPNNRVQHFSSTGAYIDQFSNSFLNPLAITVGPGGIYVADTGHNQIQQFDFSETFVRSWGGTGTANGQFNLPEGIAADWSSGDIFVTEQNGNRVQRFTSSGVYVTKWGSLGSSNGQFSGPQGIAVHSDSTVVVGDSGNNRIQKFDNNGNFLGAVGASGTGNGQFQGIFGVSVDTADNIYAVDPGNYRIQKFAWH